MEEGIIGRSWRTEFQARSEVKRRRRAYLIAVSREDKKNLDRSATNRIGTLARCVAPAALKIFARRGRANSAKLNAPNMTVNRN